jgi:hypothetical protein
MKKQLLIPACMAIVAFMLVSCTAYQTPLSITPSPVPVTEAPPVMTTPAPVITPTAAVIPSTASPAAPISIDNNAAFNAWVVANLKIISADLSSMQDFLTLGLSSIPDTSQQQKAVSAADRLRADSEAALTELDKYKVSPEMQTFQTEYRAFLSDLGEAGHLSSAAFAAYNSSELEKSKKMLESAFSHIDIAKNAMPAPQ